MSAYTLTLIVWVYLHWNFSGRLRNTFLFLQEWHFRSSSSLILVRKLKLP